MRTAEVHEIDIVTRTVVEHIVDFFQVIPGNNHGFFRLFPLKSRLQCRRFRRHTRNVVHPHLAGGIEGGIHFHQLIGRRPADSRQRRNLQPQHLPHRPAEQVVIHVSRQFSFALHQYRRRPVFCDMHVVLRHLAEISGVETAVEVTPCSQYRIHPGNRRTLHPGAMLPDRRPE